MHFKIFLRSFFKPRGSTPGQPGLTSHITLKTDQLMIQMGEQPKIPVFAESQTSFFLKVVEWAKNAKDEVAVLVNHQDMNIKLARTMEINSVQSKP